MSRSTWPARIAQGSGEEVLLPGELEHRAEMERRQNGIPFADDKWNDMLDRLEKCGVDVAPWRVIESTPT